MELYHFVNTDIPTYLLNITIYLNHYLNTEKYIEKNKIKLIDKYPYKFITLDIKLEILFNIYLFTLLL